MLRSQLLKIPTNVLSTNENILYWLLPKLTRLTISCFIGYYQSLTSQQCCDSSASSHLGLRDLRLLYQLFIRTHPNIKVIHQYYLILSPFHQKFNLLPLRILLHCMTIILIHQILYRAIVTLLSLLKQLHMGIMKQSHYSVY